LLGVRQLAKRFAKVTVNDRLDGGIVAAVRQVVPAAQRRVVTPDVLYISFYSFTIPIPR
jgi:hypothetical protein